MAQLTDVQLKALAEAIKNESNDKANTAQRIGQLLVDFVDSMANLDELPNDYFPKNEFINQASGGNDSGKPVVLNGSNQIDSTLLPASTGVGVTAHGALTGLPNDDHPQYHNDARGDIRYYQKAEHINVSAGATDAAKPIIADASGKIDGSLMPELAITKGVVAAESTITAFAANNAAYTFEQGDLIIINGATPKTYYLYQGGAKTTTTNYVSTSPTQIDWSNVINKVTFSGIGTTGIVPDPVTTSGRVLKDDGTWGTVSGINAFLTFLMSTADILDSDPGAANIKLSVDDFTGLSIDDPVSMFVSDTNASPSIDVSSLLQDIPVGTQIAIRQATNTAKQILLETTAIGTDNTGYTTIAMQFKSAGGGFSGPSGLTFDDGEPLVIVVFEQGAVTSGSDIPETIAFDNDLDQILEVPYITPIQITDVATAGITSLATAYSVRVDDGVSTYADAGSVESVSEAAMNANLGARPAGQSVMIRTAPQISRVSTIFRTRNVN